MKPLIQTLLISCALAAPAIASAQTSPTNGPVTRAQVRDDLVRVEQAGYHPIGKDPYYPLDIQAAEAKAAAQDPSADMSATAVGGVAQGGMSESGAPAMSPGSKSIYSGH